MCHQPVQYLDSVFERRESISSRLPADGEQVDVAVQVSQLSSSDGVWTVHLNQSTIGCSPLMRSRTLKHTITMSVLLVMVLITLLLIILLTIKLLLLLYHFY